MTKKEAAKFLGVTERTINNYITKGYLKQEITEEDLKQLKSATNSLIPFNKISFNKLLLQVEKQERELNIIKRVLNLYNEPHHLNDKTILAIYDMAEVNKIKYWPDDWQFQWADFISRLTEKDLDQLEKLSSDKHPWLKFYKLCSSIEEMNLSPEINSLYKFAIHHVLQLAVVWVKIHEKNIEVLQVIHKARVSALAYIAT
jgi:hypothetical protein